MKPRFRPSLAEQRRVNQQALDYLRAMSPNENAPRIDVGAKPKRKRIPPRPLERDVQRAILHYLRVHPLVAWVGRFNRGAVSGGDGRFVRFNTVVGCSDLLGQLKTGNLLAIECKRPGERATEEQAAFLAIVNANRGCAGCCDSVEAVEKLLKDWRL
jgi:hypothetical protein